MEWGEQQVAELLPPATLLAAAVVGGYVPLIAIRSRDRDAVSLTNRLSVATCIATAILFAKGLLRWGRHTTGDPYIASIHRIGIMTGVITVLIAQSITHTRNHSQNHARSFGAFFRARVAHTQRRSGAMISMQAVHQPPHTYTPLSILSPSQPTRIMSRGDMDEDSEDGGSGEALRVEAEGYFSTVCVVVGLWMEAFAQGVAVSQCIILTVGQQPDISLMLWFLGAACLHKLANATVLTISMLSAGCQERTVLWGLLIFACAGPLGIALVHFVAVWDVIGVGIGAVTAGLYLTAVLAVELPREVFKTITPGAMSRKLSLFAVAYLCVSLLLCMEQWSIDTRSKQSV